MRLTFGLLLLFAANSLGQDLVSGPDKGKAVPSLQVHDVTGPHEGKQIDYTSERKNAPTVFAFVQADKWDRPTARFLLKLDEALLKEGKEAAVVAVWLTDSRDKTKEYLPVAQRSLNFQVTALTYFDGERSGPSGWGINTDAFITVVVANAGKVAAVFAYRSVNETAVPEVMKAFREATAKK